MGLSAATAMVAETSGPVDIAVEVPPEDVVDSPPDATAVPPLAMIVPVALPPPTATVPVADPPLDELLLLEAPSQPIATLIANP